MKNIFLFLFLFLCIFSTQSFSAVGDNVIKSPNNILLSPGTGKSVSVDGKLNVSSSTIASKPYPSMTTAQRDAIAYPSSGDIVFNATTSKLNVYTNSAWGDVSGGSGLCKTIGITGDTAIFSVNFGGTTNGTNCTSTPCFIDQIGTDVSSITRSTNGTYAINFTRTFAKVKCKFAAASPGPGLLHRTVASVDGCSNCSSIAFYTASSGTLVDTFGSAMCHGLP